MLGKKQLSTNNNVPDKINKLNRTKQ